MGSAAARDPGPPPLPVGEQLVALLGSVVVALEVEVEAEGVDDGRGEVLERPATREFDVAIEPTVELPRGAVGALRPSHEGYWCHPPACRQSSRSGSAHRTL